MVTGSATDFAPQLPKYMWLAILAFGLQFLIVKELSDPVSAKLVLGVSHVLLGLCVVRNWRRLGFLIIGIGLALNLVVIYANGGLMPVAPEAVWTMRLADSPDDLRTGERIGAKNVLLAPDDTRFYALSDRIPTTTPRPRLYSVGDAVIAGGLVLAIGEVAWLVVVAYGYRLIRRGWFSRLRERGL